MNQRETEVKNKVCSVALTDSAHNIWLQETTKSTQEWMLQVKSFSSFVFVGPYQRSADTEPQKPLLPQSCCHCVTPKHLLFVHFAPADRGLNQDTRACVILR